MRVEIEATNMDTGKTASAVATFREGELALRLFEALMQMKAPAGTPWRDALAEIDRTAPTAAAGCRRCANAAMMYFRERVELAGREPDEPLQ